MLTFEALCCDHAACLLGQRPWDVSRSADLLERACIAALTRYRRRECLVGIDLYNVEAEAYGCSVREPEGLGAPTIIQARFTSPQQILQTTLTPETDGRLPMILEVAERLSRARPDITVRVPLAGPFSIAAHLLGLETMVCELVADPEGMLAALRHLARNQVAYARAALERGARLTLFESAVTPPLLSPRLFNGHVAPVLADLLDSITAPDGQRPRLVIGGNTLPIVQDILRLHPAAIICPVETDQVAFLQAVRAVDKAIQVRVNLPPSAFLGTPDQAKAAAATAVQRATAFGCNMVGALLPAEANPACVQAAIQTCEESP